MRGTSVLRDAGPSTILVTYLPVGPYRGDHERIEQSAEGTSHGGRCQLHGEGADEATCQYDGADRC